MAVYLDGNLDVVDEAGKPANNPVGIRAIGAATGTTPFAVGTLRGQYAFTGDIADVWVFTSARTPNPAAADATAITAVAAPKAADEG